MDHEQAVLLVDAVHAVAEELRELRREVEGLRGELLSGATLIADLLQAPGRGR